MTKLITDPGGRRWTVHLGGMIGSGAGQPAYDTFVLHYESIDGNDSLAWSRDVPSPGEWEALPESQLVEWLEAAKTKRNRQSDEWHD